MTKIAFTTSIPVEVILAAGKIPADLNNTFITSPSARIMVESAEEAGYPRNTCGWIKGLYTAALQEEIESLIAVMQGDCSNTEALMETLQVENVKIIPFAYPYDRDPSVLKTEVEKLMKNWEVTWEQAEAVRKELNIPRDLCKEIDRMTWKDNLISGSENHLFLVNSSDFEGDPLAYTLKLQRFIEKARNRKPKEEKVRLAYIGVPPIFTDLYEVIESLDARVVYNEIQRQFSMPFTSRNLIEQYVQYTYPYGAFARLEDIIPELEKRKVDGVIHYTQTFCYRQIEDLIFRKKIKLPFLTLEGDQPGKVDARTRMRLEAFINMLKYK